MIFVDVCVGSSCHLSGSHEIVEMMKNEIAKRNLDDEVVLSGCFCLGKCNRSMSALLKKHRGGRPAIVGD
ncbi:MAG: (2Fe-2S) ferredoxin domain-containing protein, partial [Clostridia bacterium]|nr:(2Fe-2S) ferredoxin domain-containing protein [Clostridia bacterium]